EDARAFAGELQRRFVANAAVAAGDDGGFARQVGNVGRSPHARLLQISQMGRIVSSLSIVWLLARTQRTVRLSFGLKPAPAVPGQVRSGTRWMQIATSSIACSISACDGMLGAMRMLRSRGSLPCGNVAPALVSFAPASAAIFTTALAQPTLVSTLMK